MYLFTQLCKMIHNKYFEIMDLFLGNYNRQIYGRELISKITLSQKGIALALEDLEKEGLLKSSRKGNMKFYSLNTRYPQLKENLIITEFTKKNLFLGKNKKIGHIFQNDNRVVGIFGSYAKGIQKEDSDIDVFIIGEKVKEDYDEKGKIYGLNISIKYFSEKEFKNLLKNKNNLIKETIEHHILIFNIEKFISKVWRDYYGFN